MCVRIQCSALHLRVPVTQDPFHFFMLSTTTTTRAFSESSCDRKWFPTRHPRTQGQLTLNTRDHEYTLTCGNTMQRMKHSVSDVVDFFLPFNEENVLRQVMAIRTHKGLDVCRGRIREEWRSKRDAGSRIHERIESLLRSQLFDADHDPTPSEPIDAFTGAGELPFSESEEPCSTPACSYDGPLSLTADRLVFEYLIPNYEFLTVECGLVTPERSMAGCIDAIAIHKKDWERFRSSSVHSTDESCVLPLNLFEWKTSVASLPLPSRTLEDDPPPPLFALDWEQVGDVHGTAKPARHMMRPCTIPPLQHLYNTKWSRYALQMSLYSYLLAQEGYLHHFVSSFLAARGIKPMRRQVSLQVRCDVFVIGPEVPPPSPPTSEGRGQGAVPRSIPNVTVRRFVPHEMLDPYLEKERGAMKAREHCSAHISPESRNVAQSSREGKENVWCLEAWKPGEVLRGEEHDQQGSESAMVAFRSLMEKVLDRFQSHHSQSMCPKDH